MEQENAGLSTVNIHSDPIDIEFINVTKLYGDVVALDNTNLKIPPGFFHSLLGPSGCGKTTSLRLIAGFEQPTRGDVQHRGVSMIGMPAYKRPVNMVFQHYAPFPHLNVEENISYGPRQRSPRLPKQEINAIATMMLIVSLTLLFATQGLLRKKR